MDDDRTQRSRISHVGTDGRRHFSLGPVEMRIVIGAAAVLTALGVYLAKSTLDRLDKQGDALNMLVTQVAVANQQLLTLSEQTSAVPTLTRVQAELRVQVAEHDRRLTRLEDGGSDKLKGWTK